MTTEQLIAAALIASGIGGLSLIFLFDVLTPKD